MKRVLFVDDEPEVLAGLQRSLRHRKDWEMAFAGSGAEALELFQSAPFDVIVSDLRMPEMDGTELLERIRAQYPGTIRIALSGCLELEAALRAAGVVHQYLAKPCDSGQLADAIERFYASTAILTDETARRVVGAIGNLPCLSRTASAILAALQRPNVSLREVGDLIASDVAMAAKILQLVNSPLFGLYCEITSVQSALVLIGMDTLRRIAVLAEVFRAFEFQRPIAEFSLPDFEAHSGRVARIAAALPLPKSILPGCATAALLHDIGKLVLAVRLPDQFERNLQLSREQDRPLYLTEEESLGISHAEVGAYLLSLWGLSDSIVEAVCHHHRPARSRLTDPGLDITGIVHVADALAAEIPPCGCEPAGPGPDLLDMQYLAAHGAAGQLPAWRQTAGRLVAKQPERQISAVLHSADRR